MIVETSSHVSGRRNLLPKCQSRLSRVYPFLRYFRKGYLRRCWRFISRFAGVYLVFGSFRQEWRISACSHQISLGSCVLFRSGKTDPVQFKGRFKQGHFCLQNQALCKQFSPLEYSLEKGKLVFQSLSETPFKPDWVSFCTPYSCRSLLARVQCTGAYLGFHHFRSAHCFFHMLGRV